jgi:hypothetical protein
MPIADKETTTPTDEISVGEAIYSEVIIGEEEWRQKKKLQRTNLQPSDCLSEPRRCSTK